MSIIATAVRHLMAAGVTGDALVAAIAELEEEVRKAARAEPKVRSAGAIRQERYRRNKASQVTECDESDDCDEEPSLPPPPLPSPHTPQPTPPAPTHPKKHTPRTRGSRLPTDWEPTPLPAELAWSVSRWPAGAIERELARFRDWAASATGRAAVKSDWQAAWRNWIRKAEDEGRYPTNDRSSPQRSQRNERRSVREIGEDLARELLAGEGQGDRAALLLSVAGQAGGHDGG